MRLLVPTFVLMFAFPVLASAAGPVPPSYGAQCDAALASADTALGDLVLIRDHYAEIARRFEKFKTATEKIHTQFAAIVSQADLDLYTNQLSALAQLRVFAAETRVSFSLIGMARAARAADSVGLSADSSVGSLELPAHPKVGQKLAAMRTMIASSAEVVERAKDVARRAQASIDERRSR